MDVNISSGIHLYDDPAKFSVLPAFADRDADECTSMVVSESDEETYDDVMTHTTMQEDADGFTLIVVETLPDGTNRQTTIQAGRCEDEKVPNRPNTQIHQQANVQVNTDLETVSTNLPERSSDTSELDRYPLQQASSDRFRTRLDSVTGYLPGLPNVKGSTYMESDIHTDLHVGRDKQTLLDGTDIHTDIQCNDPVLPTDNIVHEVQCVKQTNKDVVYVNGVADTLSQEIENTVADMLASNNSLEVEETCTIEYIEEAMDSESPVLTSVVTSALETECAANEIVVLPATNGETSPSGQVRLDYTRPSKRDKLFQCSVCQKRFTSLSSCQDHVLLHTGVKPHTCHICGMAFAAKGTLRGHLRAHEGLKLHVCPHCGKSYAVRKSLVSHLTKHSSVSSETPHACRKCDTSFATVLERDAHMSSHVQGSTTRFRCQECGKDFQHNSHLQRHLKTHTGEKPFTCSYCSKTFAQKVNLAKHLTLHSQLKPFDCRLCNKAYANKGYLKEHLKTHKEPDAKSWYCSKCLKCFRYQSLLVRHQRSCKKAEWKSWNYINITPQ